jgi:hypothetical protein
MPAHSERRATYPMEGASRVASRQVARNAEGMLPVCACQCPIAAAGRRLAHLGERGQSCRTLKSFMSVGSSEEKLL